MQAHIRINWKVESVEKKIRHEIHRDQLDSVSVMKLNAGYPLLRCALLSLRCNDLCNHLPTKNQCRTRLTLLLTILSSTKLPLGCLISTSLIRLRLTLRALVVVLRRGSS